ncbi:head maturation protease, ClpP-related [Shimia ponticola]|uniref:head maturation protease, ClpP-related n=1 Tax=Shimia ponticola TaxID=2582893 RepID=UPI0011BF69A9|nr:head maturation protease, ClpP-related [Shimia ponticola]
MTDIYLYGTVGQSFWDEACFTASDVVQGLTESNGGPVTVHLNSGGGILNEGTTIHNLLRNHAGDVTIQVEGIAASAASVIAMAGDTIVMGHGAQIMIHDPAQMFTDGRGTEDDHRRAAEGLGQAATAMAQIYAARSGQPIADVRQIMKAETYLNAADAVAQGFADQTSDDPATEQEVAAFNYAIYKRAPASLLSAAPRAAKPDFQPALVAMMAGLPAQQRSSAMAAKDLNTLDPETAAAPVKTAQAVAAADDDVDAMDDDETTAADASDIAAMDDDAEAAAGGDDDIDAADDDDDNPATATQLTQMVANFGLQASVAAHMIAKSMTATEASAHIAKVMKKDNPMTGTPRRGPSRATILRDERDTRNEGMTAALVAQLSRQKDVTGPARDYMANSLVEIAAMASGYDGPLRTATDKIKAFTAAAHSTSDFPAIFENVMHKRLLDSYNFVEPTYRRISEEISFADFREVPLVRAGDFPDLQPIGDNAEIKHGTFGESKETALLAPYGIQITISRTMMINDDLGAIDRVLSRYGQRIAQWEDRTFYSFALNAKMSDGQAMFRTQRGNLAGTGAALTIETLDAANIAFSEQKGIDGETLDLIPSIILTGAKQSLAAKRIVADITASSAAEVNPFSGDYEHVQTPRIAGNEWYVLTAPNAGGGAQWVYGYLDGAEGPRVRTDEPFGSQGFGMSVEHDFGVGAQDTRFAYKNPGQP